ncbi:MAG: patatin-like phospholipase family protein [Candidatus Pacebacteria bacterium]|nr:patatin-like phospholipase family protein [Candidatus Paceibacterota bacterium]
MKDKTKRLGLALGSGGWRGLAHLGVMKALLTHGIKFEIIAGSSAGALMGGAYAATQDIEKLESFFKSLKMKDLIKLFGDFRPDQGLFRGESFKTIIQQVIGEVKIEDLPFSYGATAVDFNSGELIFIKEGSLTTAIRASVSVPLVFQPVKVGNKQLVDGATRMPVPVELARELGADKVIAVNLYKNVFPVKSGKYSSIQMALKSSHLLLSELARRDCETADLALYPDIPEGKNYSIFSKFIGNAEQIIKFGEQIVELNLSKIRQLTS